MHISKIIVIVFCALTSLFNNIQCLTYGSNTAVAVAALTTVASGDPTNQIIGFSAFANGLTIPNASTLCYYNNFFPIYGPVTMNGGLLNLSRDLTFGSNVTLPTAGQFNGNGNSLFLPTKTTPFEINGGIMGNVTVVANSPLQLNSLITFTNRSVIEGNGNIIDCASGGIVVGSGGSLKIQNATIKGMASNKFYCADNTATVTLQDVTCLLSNTLTFSQGRMDFVGTNMFSGAQVFLYQSTRSMTVKSNTTLMFDSGMTFSYAANANNLISFDDVSSVLKLSETTLYAGASGLRFTKGSIVLDGLCPMLNDGTSSLNGISIGDGISSANNAVLTVLAESGIVVNRGYFVNNNV
jgi:hypothetical protein